MARGFRKEHAGVTYLGSRDDESIVTGSITNGDKKWTIKGHPKINKTEGSYKHGGEVQITIWNKLGATFEKPRVQYNQDGSPKVHLWETVEIFFPPQVWHSLIREYLREVNKKNV